MKVQHIIIKFLKTSDKEKNFKIFLRKKDTLNTEEQKARLTTDILRQILYDFTYMWNIKNKQNK